MIRCVIVVNNQGKPRILRFYDETPHEKQQQILNSVHSLVSKRSDDHCCCFADGEHLFGPGHKIVYRHFATLYFIFVIDSAESELGILDLVQVFVQVLDSCFENVCELDLIYNFDKVNYILDEIIIGGMVMETSVDNILKAIKVQKQAEAASTSFFGVV
eukprot:Platyproteum_vivax@DN8846_c0_g1_i2.p1